MIPSKSPILGIKTCREAVRAPHGGETARVKTLPDQSPIRPDKVTLAGFGVHVFLLAMGAITVRHTFREVAPFWGGFLRFSFAAMVFWGIVWARKIPVPRGRALRGAAVYGILGIGMTFLFILWGLVKTPASVYSVTIAVIPLLTLLLAVVQKVERFRLRALLGSACAAVGIAVIMSASISAGVQISFLHIASILLSAFCTAEAGVLVKLIPPSHPVAINAVGMTLSAPLMLVASWLSGEAWSLPSSPDVWLAFVWMAAIGAVAGFLLSLVLIQRWTASGVSYAFVLSPILTVILASRLVGETITWTFGLGMLLVLSGVWAGAMLGR